jgi:hypothetical protein
MRLTVNLLIIDGTHLRLVGAREEIEAEKVPESARRFQCSEAEAVELRELPRQEKRGDATS